MSEKNILREGSLEFIFADGLMPAKFDETRFYKKFASALPSGKGVDFIAAAEDSLILIEVKNCEGYERENEWRTLVNQKRGDEETFDVEIARKVASTLSCLVGANTYPDKQGDDEPADELKPYFEMLTKMRKGKVHLKVYFFLEGDFATKTRTKDMIWKRIEEKIKEYFKGWLSCTVKIVDSAKTPYRYFTVRKL